MPTALYSKYLRKSLSIKAILIAGIFFCISIVATAQSAKQYLSYGDDAMKKGEYYNASQYYKEGLDKYEFNLEMKYKYAEALRLSNDYKAAADTYKKLLEEDVTHVYPLTGFWYGMMLHYLGHYDAAATQYKKFKTKYKEHDYYQDKAQQEIESCGWATANSRDTNAIKIIHLPEGVNTPYSETNPFEDPHHHFLFSSLRDQRAKKSKPKFLARIYESDFLYTASKKIGIKADEDKNIANGAWSQDGERFYFTECSPDENNSAELRCDIYVSHIFKDSLLEPVKLESGINAPGYTSTQPNIGVDEKGEEILYYVSDRAGGAGKTDIWMSKIINDSTYAEPVNLGKQVNSIDEEFSPYYDSYDHTLYFASNWYYGFGGLDIFETRMINGVWSAPKNLGHNINSSQNDFYFYKSMDRGKNYFASNRKGSLFLESETCCNDIWMYETGHKTDIPKRVDTPVAVVPAVVMVDSSVSEDIVAVSHADTSAHIFIDRTITKMKQLLPVTLYFHNDEPECCNLRDTTSLNYVESYQDYWKLLATYKSEFDRGLQADKKSQADQEIYNLFTYKVEKGYYNLIAFSAQMLDVLQSGKKLEITIQGYCSPLNYSEYNIMLGYRRIASLRNYFYHYRDAALMPYIQSGKLVLKNESLGKEKAAITVSDNREDVRNSVYNPAAAAERKVEIISVEVR